MTTFRIHIITILLSAAILTSCSVDRFIPEEQYLLKDASINTNDNSKVTKELSLKNYIKQTPNTKIFGVKFPLKIYCLSGKNDSRWYNKMLRKIGEDPVLYNESSALQSSEAMEQVLRNSGYMKAEVTPVKSINKKKLSLQYNVNLGEMYYIRNVRRETQDDAIRDIICGIDTLDSWIRPGAVFNINNINEERSRIANKLRSIGYYKFTKQDITFVADTTLESTNVDVTIRINQHLENGRSLPENHKPYYIGDVRFLLETTADDTTGCNHEFFRGIELVSKGSRHFRRNMLYANTQFRSGDLYNDKYLKNTYTNFTSLPAVSYSNVRLKERPGTDTLDVDIIANRGKLFHTEASLEGTNTAGDLGAAASAMLQIKNIFKGSETFTFKVRGAYEAITGLEGYDGTSFREIGYEAKITFPSFLLPFVKRDWGMLHHASSEIAFQSNTQNRPEFNRRVFTAAWRYRWSSMSQSIQHKFDLLEVNYVYMPWISGTFKEQYLDSIGKTNAILKYNYENILITKLGYTYSYNSLGHRMQTYGQDAYTFKWNIETSGNMLKLLTSAVNGKKNDAGQYTFCGIAFAQYIKTDLDFGKSIKIDKNNSVAFHIAGGVAYPYGNSNILPFEKRYFAGGANSVRGWSVRSLGPGRYNGTDKGINFINQSGDVKLDMSMEYRTHLFWKFNGAFFIDAGNIWTIKEYDDQPGGAFRLDSFLQEIAFSYGLGLRMSLDFFTLRLDAGMKAINPAYTGIDHYPLIRPNLSRDFAFHFAVGLPF
ncbi:MAG: BamA/TamA family outer membrane protein [Bacteroidaceae bacterium]|nr:BamA/TamA family outer membrane protein [Bacteroidaceae bacterium]